MIAFESVHYGPTDLEALLVRLIVERNTAESQAHGYDVYLPDLVSEYMERERNIRIGTGSTEVRDLIAALYPIAWSFCLRGILRPGVRRFEGQSLVNGPGNGFSITAFGSIWLTATNREHIVPDDPARFGRLLEPHRQRFGNAFLLRAHEAMLCKIGRAHLACCVMCGAAAESILLAAASEKIGPKEAGDLYRNKSGAKKLQDVIFAQSHHLKAVAPYLALLTTWRNDSAHGEEAEIGPDEAAAALHSLLAFAIHVRKHWGELTKKAPAP